MLLNLCSKLSQRIDLYHVSTVKDHDFFFSLLSLLLTEQLVSSSDLISMKRHVFWKCAKDCYTFARNTSWFRRLFSTAYICLELYKPGSVLVVFLNQRVLRPIMDPHLQNIRKPYASSWHHQHVLFVST